MPWRRLASRKLICLRRSLSIYMYRRFLSSGVCADLREGKEDDDDEDGVGNKEEVRGRNSLLQVSAGGRRNTFSYMEMCPFQFRFLFLLKRRKKI